MSLVGSFTARPTCSAAVVTREQSPNNCDFFLNARARCTSYPAQESYLRSQGRFFHTKTSSFVSFLSLSEVKDLHITPAAVSTPPSARFDEHPPSGLWAHRVGSSVILRRICWPHAAFSRSTSEFGGLYSLRIPALTRRAPRAAIFDAISCPALRGFERYREVVGRLANPAHFAARESSSSLPFFSYCLPGGSKFERDGQCAAPS